MTTDTRHISTDTIAAIATPVGRGGIGIIRISGPAALDIGSQIAGLTPNPRFAHHCRFKDAAGETLDDGLLLFFPGPASFTGEDVLELQGHGGTMVLAGLLHRIIELGARQARPGEFSERAFLNDKLDLTQATAVADLIDAGSQAAARAALRSLDGEFSRQVHALAGDVTALRVHIEAAIDFPEEEIDFLADPILTQQMDQLEADLHELLRRAEQGRLLRDGAVIAIAGEPNVGKSSLLNQLSGSDTAIVTAQAGTTRDVLRIDLILDGLPIQLIDTAGLRETDDEIESEGIRRARDVINKADHLLIVMDDRDPQEVVDWATLLPDSPANVPHTVLRNKCDLSDHPAGLHTDTQTPALRISAKTGDGLDELRHYLTNTCGWRGDHPGSFSARKQQIAALQCAEAALSKAGENLKVVRSGEMAAEDLRMVNNYLGEIVGELTADDLLGEIFGSFCIGK